MNEHLMEAAASKHSSIDDYGQIVFPEGEWDKFVAALSAPQADKVPAAEGAIIFPNLVDIVAAMSQQAKARTSAENIADVLGALAAAWNSTPPAKLPQEAQPWPAGLLDRVKAAEQRIQDNQVPRRIPADPNGDVDLVLAEVRHLLEGKAPPFWIAAPQPARAGAVELTKEDVRKFGASVHNDGNVFFTNLAQLNAAIAAATTAAAGGKDQFGRTPDMVRFQNMMDAGDEE